MRTENDAGATRRSGVRLPPSLRRPSSIPWEGVLDVIAAITFVIAVTQCIVTGDFAALPVLALMTATVVIRRKYPLAATIAATIASGLVLLTPGAVIAVWTMAQVVLLTAALRLKPPIVMILGVIHAATLYVGALVTFAESPVSSLALITPVWTVAVISAGFALRTQRAYVAALEKQADDAVRNREALAQQRIGEERLRIARDLHDSLAHSIAVAGIHALAADATVDTAPSEARRSLQQIHATMRSTQSELQGILRVLRVPTEAADPVIGQEAIPALVESFTESIRLDHEPTTLPPLDAVASAALYRLVQEGLTNAHKHGTGNATLRCQVDSGILRTVISNPVRPDATAARNAGFGLIGMRERVESAGGRLIISESQGQFTVIGELPIATAENMAEGSVFGV